MSFSLESDRIRIIPISMEYDQVIFKEFTDEITEHMFPKTPETIDETQQFISQAIKQNNAQKNLQCIILKSETNEFLGCCGIHHINKKTPELGIWIKKSAHGNGYGREAVTLLKKWADKNLDYDYLLYPVAKENIASKKIPESLGGIPIREYKDKNGNGKLQNLVEYHIKK